MEGAELAATFSELSASIRGISDPRHAISELLEALASLEGEHISWVTLVEELLLIVRKSPPSPEAFEAIDSELPGSVIAGIEAETVAIVKGHSASTFVNRSVFSLLLELVHDLLEGWDGAESLGAILAARGIAGGIDICCWSSFVPWFRNRIVCPIEPNAAYPVFHYDASQHISAAANTRPDHLPHRRLDEVPHLRLGLPTTLPYRLELNFDLWYKLDELSQVRGPRIASLVPNLTLAEFDIMEGTRPNTFLNNGPKDSTAQVDRIVQMVEHAAKERVQIVVIPEYCISEEMREPLRKKFEAISPRPYLIVGGSSDRELGGESLYQHVNEGWLLVLDQRDLVGALPEFCSLSLSKVFPAVVEGFEEDTAPRSEICVFWTAGWAFAVMICRDAMSQELVRYLGDIGVNLLLVPAFSNRTATLVRVPCDLRSVSQAFVAIAIAPARWTFDDGDAGGTDPPRSGDDDHVASRVEAAFDGPYETPLVPLVAPGDEAQRSGLSRGFWLFDAYSRSVTWHHDVPDCN